MVLASILRWDGTEREIWREDGKVFLDWFIWKLAGVDGYEVTGVCNLRNLSASAWACLGNIRDGSVIQLLSTGRILEIFEISVWRREKNVAVEGFK